MAEAIYGKVHLLALEMFGGDLPAFAEKSIHLPGDDSAETNGATALHSHDFYEVVVVHSGSGVHCRSCEEELLRPGMVRVIKPGEVHSYRFDDRLELLNFMISPALLRSFGSGLREIPGFVELFERGESPSVILNSRIIAELDIQCNAIAMEYFHRKPGGALSVTAKTLDMLITLLRSIGDASTPPDTCSGSIAAAVSYMLNHYQDPLKISMLAKMVNCSESSFYRRFVAEFKLSPQKYLLKLRISKAREFLTRSDMTVNEVSAACGFNDPLYFSRQFRHFAGCSPKEYRKASHGVVSFYYGQTESQRTVDGAPVRKME